MSDEIPIVGGVRATSIALCTVCCRKTWHGVHDRRDVCLDCRARINGLPSPSPLPAAPPRALVIGADGFDPLNPMASIQAQAAAGAARPRSKWDGLLVLVCIALGIGLIVLLAQLRPEQSGLKDRDVKADAAWAIAESQDVTIHRDAFTNAAADLIRRGKCTKGEIREFAGFWRVPSSSLREYAFDRDIGEVGYFTNCGDTNKTRWYVAVRAGSEHHRLFQ